MRHRRIKYATFLKLLLVCLAGYCSTVFAQASPAAYQVCVACHGNEGQGNGALKAPALAGQHDWYLDKQLNDFANGIRGTHKGDVNGKQMLGFAAQLSTPDTRNRLIGFLSGLPAKPPAGQVKGDMMNGSRYYQAKCGACHGGKGEGNKAFSAPNIAILDPDYLALQMKHFQQGVRGYHKDDRLGRQMAMMAKTVSDKELSDIIYYITEQNR